MVIFYVSGPSQSWSIDHTCEVNLSRSEDVANAYSELKDILKYRCECTTGNIAQGRGREANIARGEAECYICLETTPACNISRGARA